ncbi:MAG: aminoacyl-tRNA hydrolase [Candidatus Marinimicrobia bacterium]|nr:aminoacyl-tRNA hydrolase [Candidatus Neomarinimicrobiota bacterium]
MRLIIGLGNPGSRFARTRHNFGYWAVDALARAWKISFGPGKGDYLAAISSGSGLALIKPTGGMNNSGYPVQDVVAFYKSSIQDVLVIFDDIDLPLGTLRFRPRGGAGGHKGVVSLIRQLGTENFPRLRLGIATDSPMRPSEKYVLSPFRRQDGPVVERVLEEAIAGINYYLEYGSDMTMAQFNTRSSG